MEIVVFIVIYNAIKFKDNDAHLNNFSTKTTFHHPTYHVTINNVVSKLVIKFQPSSFCRDKTNVHLYKPI